LRFAGIDVGAFRKGFHCAVVFGDEVVAGPVNLPAVGDVAAWLAGQRPRVVAVDSPCVPAAPGETARAAERALAQEVCGIRWTPDSSRLASSSYYEWVRNGLRLYAALRAGAAEVPWEVIEVFPTASWTRWAGPRGARSRAEWSKAALAALGIGGLPGRRLSQDDRDAIAAALTGRSWAEGRCEQFGEIVVPLANERAGPDGRLRYSPMGISPR
jgi:predicted nuclease with RNAse H fold